MGTVTLGAPKTQLCVLFLDPLLGNSSTNKGEKGKSKREEERESDRWRGTI
jgi:hypothetical protein